MAGLALSVFFRGIGVRRIVVSGVSSLAIGSAPYVVHAGGRNNKLTFSSDDESKLSPGALKKDGIYLHISADSKVLDAIAADIKKNTPLPCAIQRQAIGKLHALLATTGYFTKPAADLLPEK